MNACAPARLGAIGLSALLVICGWCQLARAQSEYRGNVEHGRKLFERVWIAGQPTPAGDDGLGPLYNERSCVACHLQGGVGGAGPNEHNVEMLTAISKPGSFDLRRIHHGFAAGSSIVLHRYSTRAGYTLFRRDLLRQAPVKSDPLYQAIFMAPLESTLTVPPIQLVRSQGQMLLLTRRNTTPLFGAGLIDSLPDAFLKDLEKKQSAQDKSVTGRFVGRFGWRGQVATLKEFVLGACAVELGLHVAGHPQAEDPRHPRREPIGFDLSVSQCDDLIAYVASLPAPRRELPDSSLESSAIEKGATLFEGIGCADCHRPKLAHVDGIYSDLLLHDMGSRLDDPAPAPDRPSVEYYGPPPSLEWRLLAGRRREWKTPPLWGLRDSAPYLHDGRAATIEEAILWHGGEAGDAQVRYQILETEQQGQLIAFLSTFAAPESAAINAVGK